MVGTSSAKERRGESASAAAPPAPKRKRRRLKAWRSAGPQHEQKAEWCRLIVLPSLLASTPIIGMASDAAGNLGRALAASKSGMCAGIRGRSIAELAHGRRSITAASGRRFALKAARHAPSPRRFSPRPWRVRHDAVLGELDVIKAVVVILARGVARMPRRGAAVIFRRRGRAAGWPSCRPWSPDTDRTCRHPGRR